MSFCPINRVLFNSYSSEYKCSIKFENSPYVFGVMTKQKGKKNDKLNQKFGKCLS